MGLFKNKKKIHRCLDCKKEFENFESDRRSERIKGTKNFQIIWQSLCPHCGHIINEGDLITSSSSSISELLEKIKGD